MKKRTIIHLIDSIGRGGSETLLINTINNLEEYNNILVYLHEPHYFLEKLDSKTKVICLNKTVPKNIFTIVLKLKRLINEYQVEIVHSHSYWTNIITRFLIKNNIKVVNSYHFADFKTLPNIFKRKLLIIIDKLTYDKLIYIICVSNYVKDIIKTECRYSSNLYVINNFIDDLYYKQAPLLQKYKTNETLKIISFGNLKKEKNYKFVLESFKRLKNDNLIFDIYGDGEKLKWFKDETKKNGISNLNFLGNSGNLYELMSKYHLYCMSSYSETFGLATLEAIARNLPLLLSEIPASKEIAKDVGIFFECNNEEDFIRKIRKIIKGEIILNVDLERNESILNAFSKKKYLDSLNQLYNN